jgi:hypothetical protein
MLLSASELPREAPTDVSDALDYELDENPKQPPGGTHLEIEIEEEEEEDLEGPRVDYGS